MAITTVGNFAIFQTLPNSTVTTKLNSQNQDDTVDFNSTGGKQLTSQEEELVGQNYNVHDMSFNQEMKLMSTLASRRVISSQDLEKEQNRSALALFDSQYNSGFLSKSMDTYYNPANANIHYDWSSIHSQMASAESHNTDQYTSADVNYDVDIGSLLSKLA